MTIQKLQEGLIDWFWIDSNQAKSFNQIETICIKLFEQYYPLKKIQNAKYTLFYPLVKYGIIEFYGNNSYCLSPSSILYNDRYVLLTNVPFHLKKNIIAKPVLQSNLGLEVYENSTETFSILKELNIPRSSFNLLKVLDKNVTIETIIHTWLDDKIIDTTNYLFYNNNKWTKNNLCGVYKKGDQNFAQRTLKLAENRWKIIPSRESNIDGFNISVLWSQIKNNWDIGVKYLPEERKIILDNIFFPLIIERLLFLNTLLEWNISFEVFERQYFIKQMDFELLNNFFCNKIGIV